MKKMQKCDKIQDMDPAHTGYLLQIKKLKKIESEKDLIIIE